MPTQTSQLVSNLTQIYNTKLQIKAVLGTNSDDFTEYPDLIEAAISEGGGSGEIINPFYESPGTSGLIENEEATADYVISTISDNFEYESGNGEYTISWDEITEINTGEVGQNNSPILESKTIHVVITGDPHEIHGEGLSIAGYLETYPDLYGNIYPMLENATLSVATGADAEDGYDYVLEGELYAWNLYDMTEPVQEITESGFYVNDGALGFDVNVPTGKQVDNNLCAYLFAPDYNNLDISNHQYAPRYYTSFSFFDQEVDTTTNHDDVITAEVTYFEGPEGEPDKLPNCSYVQNLTVNWFNDVNNMGEGWFKLSFNYTGSEPIYLMFHLLKASYQTGGTDKWNMPSGYRFDSWWEDGVNFMDDDDAPSIFTIYGAGYYYFYICAGTFDGTSGTYSRSFRPPFENTSEFITPREFFGE